MKVDTLGYLCFISKMGLCPVCRSIIAFVVVYVYMLGPSLAITRLIHSYSVLPSPSVSVL